MSFETRRTGAAGKQSMSINTSQQYDSYYSPPHTPPQKSRYRTTRKAPPARPSLRETFFDDTTPVENEHGRYSGEDERDPHDLSFEPKHATRLSVVDNMLLSLDQFGGDPIPGDDSRQDPDPYTTYSRYASRKMGRPRGHTFSSSVSSDMDTYSEENSGRYTSQYHRTSRSNSSSNYHSGLQRINSVRGSNGGDGVSTRSKVYEAQRAVGPSERSLSHRASRASGKDSKSSGSSSVDFNQMLAGTRVGNYRERRSASFDYGAGVPPIIPRYPHQNSFDSRNHSRNHSAYDDIDAAPTPNVPTRSRRNISPPIQDHPGSQGAGSGTRTPALSRKNSSKSARSMYNRKGRSDTLGTGTIKGRGDDFRQYQEDIPDVPPIQNYAREPAPSPTIAFHKTSYFSNPSPQQETTSTPPQKERPGFFRRVFGGSSKNSSPSQSVREPPAAQNGDPRGDRQRPSQSAPSTSKGTKQPAPTYQSSNQNTSSQNAQQVVTKKPSSFFRRRKKSFAENIPPPLNLAQSNTQHIGNLKIENLKNGNPEPSPVSSLRKVMKPYLASPASEFESQSYDLDDADNEVSANEYTSARRKESYAPTTVRNTIKSRPDNSSKPSAESVTKVKPGLNLNFAAFDRDDSFLADSSGNEGTSLQPTERHRRPLTSPTATSHTQTFDKSSGTIRAKRPSATRNESDTTTESSIQKDGLSSSKSSLPKTVGHSRRSSSPAPASSKTDGPAQGRSPLDKGWLEPASSTEQVGESKLVLPLEGTTESRRESVSTTSNYHTASNTPIINEDDSSRWGKPQAAAALPAEAKVDEENESEEPAPKPSYDEQPTPADREQAQKLFEKPGDDLQNIEPTAAWLGSPDRGLVRKAYMELFDWAGMNILSSLRSLCVRIAVKGETQQVDRVLDAFSSRWCDCNPNHGFKATDVVHTICYSLLLLNTDLHIADIEQKMTRNQFIRNTMPTIQRVASDAAPDAFEPATTKRMSVIEAAGTLPKKSPTFPPKHRAQGSVDMDASNGNVSTPVDSTARVDSIGTGPPPSVDVGPLVTAPFRGTMKAWEVQVEAVLKDFYNSIQRQRLPLHGAPAESEEQPQQSSNFLTLTGNMLRRTPSTVSKSSDVFPRGRPADNRYATARWSSKPRSRPKLYPPSNMGSSRTSLDDQSSVWSPAASSTWSKYSLGKTLTSMSVDSFGSEYPRGDYQQSIGFANALSHAIIREDQANSASGAEESAPAASLLEDETLELAGAPWAKEGSLKHKQHLDAVDKRSKDRNWNESFAVIQRGWMRLFSFNASSKSMRVKAKRGQNIVVGGGNWMENAEETWKFLLRQTIASALPPPGYSKSRPHVFALSLPTGAVHLFQVGTPEIVKEFVSTANYWSARLSKEPLSGAISNIEYGWSDAVINSALVHADAPPATGSSGGPRPSIQSSIRSSIDQQSVRPRLPADRINISDWSPPQQTMVASTLSEAEQLTTLRNYVKHVEEELQRHNELRGAMVLAFTPRHPNAQKALANWERKSSYLLREIVKFRTYIDCLDHAKMQKEKIQGNHLAVAEGSGNASSMAAHMRERSASFSTGA